MLDPRERSTDKQVDKGKLTEEGRKEILMRVEVTDDLGCLSTCDLVVESVVEDLAARGATVVGEAVGAQLEVDDRRRGWAERPDPPDVRLDLGEPFGAQQLHVRHAVRDRSAVELLEAAEL